MKTNLSLAATLIAACASAQMTEIERTPVSVGSNNTSFFTTYPTANAALYLGTIPGAEYRSANFNTAPNGPLTEGGLVSDQYASRGVLMNAIRISVDIYGGNNYGAGFATEFNAPQIYTFSVPVRAAGMINTSPDRDFIDFYSGPNATGTVLLSFRDQENTGINFNIDRFLGGLAPLGTNIRSMKFSNASGDLELDELVFAVVPQSITGNLVLGDTGPFGAGLTRTILYTVYQGITNLATGSLVCSGPSTPFNLQVAHTVTGPVTVVFDGSSFLRSSSAVTPNGFSTSLGSVILQNGDPDTSGEVDAADIDIIISFFGTTGDTPVDLDLSGEVDAADIDIAIANFGGVDD